MSGATPRRGGRGGMVSFGVISAVSAMVVSCCESVVTGYTQICCRVYVKSGKNVYELK
jgi:hypothetical protein